MALVRWSPWQGLYQAQRDMDLLMRRVFGGFDSPWSLGTGSVTRAWVPAVDVFQRENDLVIRAELPGIDPEKDVDISVQDGALTIRGERRHEQRSEGDGSYYRMESSYGAFERTIMLPEDVNADDIRANYENGILEVVVPGAARLSGAKKIPVRAGDQKALTTQGEKK
jgi:HSP20 family protein